MHHDSTNQDNRKLIERLVSLLLEIRPPMVGNHRAWRHELALVGAVGAAARRIPASALHNLLIPTLHHTILESCPAVATAAGGNM